MTAFLTCIDGREGSGKAIVNKSELVVNDNNNFKNRYKHVAVICIFIYFWRNTDFLCLIST